MTLYLGENLGETIARLNGVQRPASVSEALTMNAAYSVVDAAFAEALQSSGAYEEAKRLVRGGERNRNVLIAVIAALVPFEGSLSAQSGVAFKGKLEALYQDAFNQGVAAQNAILGSKEPIVVSNLYVLSRNTRNATSMASIALRTQRNALLRQAADAALMLKPFSPSLLSTSSLASRTTEVVSSRGFNEGHYEAMQRGNYGRGVKTWFHTKDQHPRQDHLGIDGLQISLLAYFPIAGGVRFAHDWEYAGADEWSRCGCYTAFYPENASEALPWLGD